MYILLRIDDSKILAKVLTYLARLKVWHRQFKEKVYDVRVSVQDRIARMHRTNRTDYYLNPSAAWSTCAHFVQAWDYDSLGRIHPLMDSELARSGADKAPYGKGWVIDSLGKKRRVAGECKNPLMLNDISCPMWCHDYQPTTVEGWTHLATQIAEEHEHRAAIIRQQLAFLVESEMSYEEAIRTDKIWVYEDRALTPTLK
ncbi:MAG: hypothetical protein HW405_133 [Candidatus Berkelbacteria bacterium]|nr:hypothetical protein [Candidatus Berkelbacteria bacterium]